MTLPKGKADMLVQVESASKIGYKTASRILGLYNSIRGKYGALLC